MKIRGQLHAQTLRVNNSTTLGYVLTADASGNATWQSLGTGTGQVTNFLRGDKSWSGILKQTEVDFGTDAVCEKVFTVSDAAVTTSIKVVAWQSGTAATGRQADENEMDVISFVAIPGTGQITLAARVISGFLVSGKYKVNYIISE